MSYEQEALMAVGTRWHGSAVLVLGMAGLLIAAGISSADTSDVEAARGTDLTGLVRVETDRVAALERRVQDLDAEVEGLADAAADNPVRAVQAEVTRKADLAGFSEVEGPGVTVSLDDAPVPDDLSDLPQGTTPDDFVVHQQDVEAVVNALWTGGAEAMTIMDRRITTVSAVRCVGNVIILDGEVFSPPFTITAIGSPARLIDALDTSSGVQIYRQWADYIGLGFDVAEHESVALAAATGPTTMSFAAAERGVA
jgi:uncharacterized protein YlxW (UPF0749 family)